MAIEKSSEPDVFVAFEHAGWESVSQGYQQHFGALTSQSVEALLDAAEVSAAKRVIDVCCGPGMISAAAAARGAQVTGLDFSAAAVALARANVSAAEFEEGDAQALPFADDSADAVLCGFGIIHLPDPQRALAQMYRVLRPGGRVALSVWEAPAAGNGFGLVYGTIKAHANLDVELPHGPDFFQFSDAGKLSAALLETGFSGASVTRVAQTWEFGAASDLMDAIMQGAVRAPALIAAQTAATRQAIAGAITAGMDAYLCDDGVYRLPMPALIGAASK